MSNSEIVQPGKGKVMIGVVSSCKMNKTITVLVTRNIFHPLYGKIVPKTKKYHVHDAYNDCKHGDKVEIVETRPISKTKSWIVLRNVTTNTLFHSENS